MSRTSRITWPALAVCVLVAVALSVPPTTASLEGQEPTSVLPASPVNEIIRDADLIFIGSAARQTTRPNSAATMILTDVTFNNVIVIASSARSVQSQAGEIVLTYPGGRLGDIEASVSGTPRFDVGRRYLLFVRDDGQTYINPLVRGNESLFEIVSDSEVPTEAYVLTAGRRALTAVEPSGFEFSSERATEIRRGAIVEAPRAVGSARMEAPPLPTDPSSSASSSDTRRPTVSKGPMRLADVVAAIRFVRLQTDGLALPAQPTRGSFMTIQNGQIVHVDLPAFRARRPPTLDEIAARARGLGAGRSYADAVDLASPGGTLYACGFQGLPIVMEQVPPSWWSFAVNNDSMATWNRFMDLYRYSDDDGTYGHNGTSEFGGFATDADLGPLYGYNWGTSIAVTAMFAVPGCGPIFETDIFWNASLTWTDNAQISLGNSGVYLLRPTAMHELGHSWGEQAGLGPETYDYDVPSIMHGYYSHLVEDGHGIHADDAFHVRAIYDDQTGIIALSDVGVESYFASGGLNNSTTDAFDYAAGTPIVIQNVTVENMSHAAATDVRVRFYLSTDRIVSALDQQIGGGYWFWSTFNPESFNVSNYTTVIPATVPSGTYYVGASVTRNGFGSDDYPDNNNTTLYWPITIHGIPGYFSKTTPSNGATDRPTTLILSWAASFTATGYEYCYDTTNDGACSAWTSAGSNTSVSVSGLSAGVTYYWQVRAYNSAGTNAANTTTTGFWSFTTGSSTAVDFNGDGRADIFTYNPATGGWTIQATQSTGGFVQQTGAWAPGWTVKPARFNNDNLIDLFLFSATTGQWFKLLNNGSGGWINDGFGAWSTQWQRFVVDLNGDGLSDVFLWNPSLGQWFQCLSAAGGFSYVLGYWSPGWEVYPMRFNNDSRQDFFLFNRANGQWFQVWGQAGSTFSYPGSGTWSPVWQLYPGSYDNDGISDMLLHNPANGQYYMTTTFPGGFVYLFGGFSTGWNLYPMDLDGNGRTDLFLHNPTNGQWFEMMSTGGMTWTVGGSGTWGLGWNLYPTDFNGDGRGDLLLHNPASGQWFQARNLTLGTFDYTFGTWSTGLVIIAQ